MDFCNDWNLTLDFRINKKTVVDTSNEFGHCYKWNDLTAPPNTDIYHLAVAKDEDSAGTISESPLTEDFLMHIYIFCDKNRSPNNC